MKNVTVFFAERMRAAHYINEGKTILIKKTSSRSDAWECFEISKRTLLN